MAKHHVINYETILPRLAAGLRKAWGQARREHPGETFYLFGVCTDSDITGLFPFSHTEEQYAATGNPTYPIDKWRVPDEAYEHRSTFTAGLAAEVNRYVFEDHRKDPKGAFAERKRRLLAIFEQALVQLDAEGFFGEGEARTQVLLKIDLGDCSDDEEEYMLEVIRLINPPASTAYFFALVEVARDPDQQKAVEAASAFVRRQEPSPAHYTDAHRLRKEEITPALVKLLGQSRGPKALWEVFFEREPVAIVTKIRAGREDPGNRMVVVVDPATGHCAIRPQR
jgi:hypothetical protein